MNRRSDSTIITDEKSDILVDFNDRCEACLDSNEKVPDGEVLRQLMTRRKPKKIIGAIEMTRDKPIQKLPMTRHTLTRPRASKRASCFKLLLCVLSMLTYLGTFVLDGLLLKHYITRSDWIWFAITLIFIVLPLLIVQIFSLKWYHDDLHTITCVTKFMHSLLLGPIQRYYYILAYGFKTRSSITKQNDASIEMVDVDNSTSSSAQTESGDKNEYYEWYVEGWRDISMLRFIQSFLETGPQVTMQLYILLMDHDRSFQNLVQLNWITIVKIVFTVGLLSLSMVSYNSYLREYFKGKKLTVSQFLLQLVYRLLIIASRVFTLALFAIRFNYYVLGIVILHWFIMIYCVRMDNAKFFSSPNGKHNACFEFLFQVIVGFIYIFIFITTSKGPTRIQQVLYYIICFAENACMMIAWVMLNDRNFDTFEIIAISVVFGTFLIGVALMLIYYQVVHPTHKVVNKVVSEKYQVVHHTHKSVYEDLSEEYQVVHPTHKVVNENLSKECQAVHPTHKAVNEIVSEKESEDVLI